MLEVRNIGKRYGRVVALENVSATFRPGEIHAVLGENGAGKSTLMSVMSGFASPDSGTVELDGKAIPLGRAFDCKRLGIEMIHQHFTLVPEFTVAENLALARLDGLWEGVRVTERAAPSLAAAKRLGWPIEPEAKVRTLPVGVLQRLEILKALGGNAQVLILDEPTAVLSPEEVLDLFRVLRQLRDEGRIVILIAHKLSEVLAIADFVTVLRRGRFVASASRAEVDEKVLAAWMVGEMPLLPEAGSDGKFGAAGLSVHDLTVLGDRGEKAVRGVSFDVRSGEVLGIGGVDGNGQIELAEAVAGVRKFSGRVEWGGRPVAVSAPRVGYVPQDRQIDGLAMGMSVEDNLLVGNDRQASLAKGAVLRSSAIRRWAAGLIERFEIRTSSAAARVAELSGGNQQKVVVSRTLDALPELLVVVNPTRGLDIRASVFVHTQILEARKRGAAVLLVSTDLDELVALSDRTVFLSRGELAEGSGAGALVGA
jgi:ABC-type uncharacterized transport system ATPase subunit